MSEKKYIQPPNVSEKFSIGVEWEANNSGLPEDSVTAAALTIRLDDTSLTDAYDAFEQKTSNCVHLSAYRLAEWLAWNWWRIRWEPLKNTPHWRLAHKLTSIGGGYIWPNTTIYSDGQLMLIEAKATEQRSNEPLRYIKNHHGALRIDAFEAAVFEFIEGVRNRLHANEIPNSNLDNTWEDVLAERADKDIALRRKLEAALGFDPDEASPALIDRLINDVSALGEASVSELASSSFSGEPPSASQLRDWADQFGLKRDLRNAVKLADRSGVDLPNAESWRRGRTAAKSLRKQCGISDRPVGTASLLEMLGSSSSIAAFKEGSPLSFELAENVVSGKVALRDTRRATSQRFDLARMLGDHIAQPSNDRLISVSSAFTYRQKMQRAFAAEFLSPFNAIDKMLEGDYYDDAAIENVAAHFEVSPLLIKSSLANNGRIGREDVFVP